MLFPAIVRLERGSWPVCRWRRPSLSSARCTIARVICWRARGIDVHLENNVLFPRALRLAAGA
jgi:hypothetical protein